MLLDSFKADGPALVFNAKSRAFIGTPLISRTMSKPEIPLAKALLRIPPLNTPPGRKK